MARLTLSMNTYRKGEMLLTQLLTEDVLIFVTAFSVERPKAHDWGIL